MNRGTPAQSARTRRETAIVQIFPLTDLTSRPETASPLRGVFGQPPIEDADGTYFGHEWARLRHDTLDCRVDEILQTLPASSRVLDLGCASGSRAAAFAAHGFDVTAVDILDRSSDIADRAAQIAFAPEMRSPGSLRFIQADLRTWSVPLSEPWHLIHARRVITFMTGDEASGLLKRLRPAIVAGGSLILSFVATGLAFAGQMDATPPPGDSVRIMPRLFSHDVRRITEAIEASGFEVTEIYVDGLCDAGCVARARP